MVFGVNVYYKIEYVVNDYFETLKFMNELEYFNDVKYFALIVKWF